MFWFSRSKPEYEPVTGLVLPGGGARNAYQVGVLRAIAEILPPEIDSPFPVITGTSSGAINATLLACTAGKFRHGVEQLSDVWGNFESRQVFYDDPWSAFKSAVLWGMTMVAAMRPVLEHRLDSLPRLLLGGAQHHLPGIVGKGRSFTQLGGVLRQFGHSVE